MDLTFLGICINAILKWARIWFCMAIKVVSFSSIRASTDTKTKIKKCEVLKSNLESEFKVCQVRQVAFIVLNSKSQIFNFNWYNFGKDLLW